MLCYRLYCGGYLFEGQGFRGPCLAWLRMRFHETPIWKHIKHQNEHEKKQKYRGDCSPFTGWFQAGGILENPCHRIGLLLMIGHELIYLIDITTVPQTAADLATASQPPPWTPTGYEMTAGSESNWATTVSCCTHAGMNSKTHVGTYSSVHWKLDNNVSDVFGVSVAPVHPKLDRIASPMPRQPLVSHARKEQNFCKDSPALGKRPVKPAGCLGWAGAHTVVRSANEENIQTPAIASQEWMQLKSCSDPTCFRT